MIHDIHFKRKRPIFRCFQQYLLFTFVFHLFVHQVVTLAVYSFFVATLMGRQLIGAQTELYIPIFAFLQVLIDRLSRGFG